MSGFKPVTSPSSISMLDAVSLLVDVPEHGLVRGDLGTVVEELGDEFFEVEFSDDSGRTRAELALSGAVLQLHHRGDVGDGPTHGKLGAGRDGRAWVSLEES
jgi:Domain of unknown function (DUF4926)